MRVDLGYAVYEGEVNEDNLPHGRGEMYYSNGGTCRGMWQNGEMCGQGSCCLPLSDGLVRVVMIYEGEFREDTFWGQGDYRIEKLVSDYASHPEDFTEEELADAAQAMEIPNAHYVGSFVNGHRDGQGIYTDDTGVRYEGEYSDGKFHGKGLLIDPENDIHYEGEFYYGDFRGMGVMRYANGDRYEGAFLADKRWGHGVMSYANGAIYDGEWHADMREGNGLFTHAFRLAADGPLFTTVYEGEWCADRRCGFGILTDTVEGCYEGMFEDNRRHGRGIQTYPDGAVYDGEWQDNVRCGMGTYLAADGTRQTGRFENDTFIGA